MSWERKKKEKTHNKTIVNVYYCFFIMQFLKNIATSLSSLQLSHCLVIFWMDWLLNHEPLGFSVVTLVRPFCC